MVLNRLTSRRQPPVTLREHKLIKSDVDSPPPPPPADLSLPLCCVLPLGGVHGGHVLGGGDEVQGADARLQQADDPAESLQPVEPGCSTETQINLLFNRSVLQLKSATFYLLTEKTAADIYTNLTGSKDRRITASDLMTSSGLRT